jgi:RNA polymerase sigma-70 factor (ECF subfamily)
MANDRSTAADGSLVTRPSLLLRVRDSQDRDAWNHFVEAYTPLVFNFCRSRGLQSADAADVAQDVMTSAASALPRFEYEPGRGRFRDWLYRVTRSKVANFHRRRGREPAGSGETDVHDMLQSQPDPADDAAAGEWERSWQQHVFDRAAAQVRDEFQPATWKAFWATAVENRPPQEVAAELGLSTGAVYIAKSRVLSRLREIVGQIDE